MLTIVVLLLGHLQLPTLGDTVWVSRTLIIPSDVSVRPRPITASEVATPLGPPEVLLRGGGNELELRYPMVVWRPGRHALEVPGPILVRRDGWSDTLPPATVTIEVGSVLPRAPIDSIPPRPPVGAVPRTTRSLLPVAILLALALVLLAPLHWWWRRRGPAIPPAPPARAHRPAPEILESWADAGEYRAALDGWRTWLLEDGSGTLPAAPGSRSALLERLEAARYEPMNPDALRRLCDEVGQAVRRAGRVP